MDADKQQVKKQPLLKIIDLQANFLSERGLVKVLEGVNLSLYSGEMLALVGETGSGKSTIAKGILNLLPERFHFYQGQVLFEGQDLLRLSPQSWRPIRGRRISMIFQHPQDSINPIFTIGEQICRLVKMYLPHVNGERQNRKKQIQQLAIEKLGEVGLTEGDHLLKAYAHQISGEIAVRVKIAMALLSSPDILIADDPTSLLDITAQTPILELLKDLCQHQQISLIFMTKDLRMATRICDRIAVMYAGRIVESAPTHELFETPLHPYTKGWLNSMLKMSTQKQMVSIQGAAPDLIDPPKGCRFHPRCKQVLETCSQVRPEHNLLPNDHFITCHLYTNHADEGTTRSLGNYG